MGGTTARCRRPHPNPILSLNDPRYGDRILQYLLHPSGEGPEKQNRIFHLTFLKRNAYNIHQYLGIGSRRGIFQTNRFRTIAYCKSNSTPGERSLCVGLYFANPGQSEKCQTHNDTPLHCSHQHNSRHYVAYNKTQAQGCDETFVAFHPCRWKTNLSPGRRGRLMTFDYDNTRPNNNDLKKIDITSIFATV